MAGISLILLVLVAVAHAGVVIIKKKPGATVEVIKAGGDSDDGVPPEYQYNYQVKDDFDEKTFSQIENREGVYEEYERVYGEYQPESVSLRIKYERGPEGYYREVSY